MQKKVFLGIDVGSVTTKCALMSEDMELIAHRYIPTSGKPIIQIQKLMREISSEIPADCEIGGAGTTAAPVIWRGKSSERTLLKMKSQLTPLPPPIFIRM